MPLPPPSSEEPSPATAIDNHTCSTENPQQEQQQQQEQKAKEEEREDETPDRGRKYSTTNSSTNPNANLNTTTTIKPMPPLRNPNDSILVPRDHPEIEIEEEWFPPDDARAMSPRRDSADLERMGNEAREKLRVEALSLQAKLDHVMDEMEELRKEHNRIEKENQYLTDYIGQLTKNLRRGDPGSRPQSSSSSSIPGFGGKGSRDGKNTKKPRK